MKNGAPVKVVRKRGRPKKKNDDEIPNKQTKITDTLKKVKRTVNRFKGVTKEELLTRLLPDRIKPDLDILIIGINPGLYAAYKGHHYAGPGNHFWQCINLSKMVDKYVTSEDDLELLNYGIGFSTIVQRTTPSAKDLTSKEIREGGIQLLEKLRIYRPRIAVFNGKGIYEIFSKEMFGQKKKDFTFGQQTRKIPDTDTVIFVMPSSSARCAQFPRAQDKVHFYIQIKQLRDTLRGMRPSTDIQEVGYAFDLQKATELAKAPPNVKQEMPDPSYNDLGAANGVDVPDGAFPTPQNINLIGKAQTSTSQTPNGHLNMTKEKSSKSTLKLVENNQELTHYLQHDEDAPGPSKLPPSARPKLQNNNQISKEAPAESRASLSPSNLQQEISEEHKSERVGSWVRDQLEQSYDDDHPPMGFEDAEENAGSAGNAGSDHASQQSTVSAGVSGSASESTSGYGSQDTTSRHVRQDRVEMWVIDQQQQQNQPPTTTSAIAQQAVQSVMNASTISNNTAVNSTTATFGSLSSCDNTNMTSISAATSGFISNPLMPFFSVSQPPLQMPSTSVSAFSPLGQSIRRVNYDVTNAVRPPVPLFSMWGRQGDSSAMSSMHPNVTSHLPVNNTLNLAYQTINGQSSAYHSSTAWHL